MKEDRVVDTNFEILPSNNVDPIYGAAPVRIQVRQFLTQLRLVLDDGKREEYTMPDVLIERRADRWFLAIHPDAGDPVAFIHVFDDGRVVDEDPMEGRPDVILREAD